MNPAYKAISIGLAMVFGALALDLAGSFFQSLPLLVVSFALAIAGALVSLRGVIEFVAERA